MKIQAAAASAVYVLALLFLAFAAGIVVAIAKVYPYPIFDDAYRAATAVFAQSNIGDDPFKTDLWRRARTPAKGVTVDNPKIAQSGYTLYTSGDGAYARLIDMHGHLLHQWHVPYSKVWTKNAAVKKPQPDDMVYMRRAELLPNGDLLALYICANDTPWGYGLVKLDANSHIIWRYLAHAHHDFDLTKDGRIITLTHSFTSQPVPGLWFLPKPYLEDFLVTLSPDGHQLQKLSLMQMLVNSPYVTSLRHDEPFYANFDPIHPNTVFWLDAKRAAALGIGKAGDVMVMFRQINLLVLVDPKAKRIVWGMRGPWLAPHDPHVLPNGHILMFDNLGNFVPHNRSRVIEFDPHTAGIKWSYPGSAKHPLDSEIRSTDQRLANGNTLITESDGGRLIEVTPDGKTAWEYVNPIRGGPSNQYIPVLSGGERIDPASLNADFRANLDTSSAKSPQ